MPDHDPSDPSDPSDLPDLPDPSELPDRDARQRIAEALDEDLFVEAGAGSGKTATLVTRLVDLVVRSGIELCHIAAITFTEKAAAELCQRVRTELTKAAASGDATTAERGRVALEQLDGAAVGTLHAFAQRLLTAHPIEVGLPPRLELLDEVGSSLAFEARWSALRRTLYTDEGLTDLLLVGMACGIEDRHLRQVAVAFGANHDLLDPLPEVRPTLPSLDLQPELDALLTICQQRHGIDPADLLAVEMDRIEREIHAIARLADPIDRLQKTRLLKATAGASRGTKGAWAPMVVTEVRAELKGAVADLQAAIDAIGNGCLRGLAHELARFTLAAADARRTEGRLEFHDLLVLARRLVRDPIHGLSVRAALHQTYQRLLLDELQDTDPIQLELARRLAAPPVTGGDALDGLRSVPGRLFVVGDPKQSIYRFRRADIELFLSARAQIGRAPVSLTTNFRSTTPVIEWINAVFALLITPIPGRQPEYQALQPVRPAAPDGPAVSVVGAAAHANGTKADEVRRLEAADIVAAIQTALAEGWSVHDADGADGWRPARPDDVAVLLPARTSLPALEAALAEAGLPYRTESSSLVYATPEIREMLLALKAVDDPSDELAIVSALRSPLFGCSDRDLYEHRVVEGRRWDLTRLPTPSGADATAAPAPVAESLALLAELVAAKPWSTPSALLELLVERCRVLELAVDRGRPDDVWRRVRFVIDQARAWSDAGGGADLRSYLAWVHRQADGTGRTVEAVLPETNDRSVRIMTIHAAKGLEFPIVVVSGLSTRPSGNRSGAAVLWDRDGTYQLKIAGAQTTEFDERQAIDEQMDHDERIRLLYVACTRARDHLVVSLHRTEPSAKGPPEPHRRPSAQLLADAGALDAATAALPRPDWVPHPWVATAAAATVSAHEAEDALASVESWEATHAALLAVVGRSRTISATRLARDARSGAAGAEADPNQAVDPALAKDPPDLELPPWHKGRYGTAIGRAVHGVLQTIDFEPAPSELAATVAAQAAAEGVLGMEATIAALVRAALGSTAVRAAAAAPRHWREVYVAAPFDDVVLEGYVDLLVEGPDGLTVVDYKTDAAASEGELDAKVERYRLQAAAYALAVEATTGRPVPACTFVFCAPEGAVERTIAGDALIAAVAEARTLITRSVPTGSAAPGA